MTGRERVILTIVVCETVVAAICIICAAVASASGHEVPQWLGVLAGAAAGSLATMSTVILTQKGMGNDKTGP